MPGIKINDKICTGAEFMVEGDYLSFYLVIKF